jgi:hypothetical protein
MDNDTERDCADEQNSQKDIWDVIEMLNEPGAIF